MISLRKGAPVDAGLDHLPVLLPRVNLLPPEIIAQARFRRVQAGLGIAVAGALGAAALLYVGAAGSVSDAQGKVDEASRQTAVLTAQTGQYRDVTAVFSKRTAAEQVLVQAMGSEVRYSRFLNDLSTSLSERVWVTKATYDQPLPAAAGAAAAAPTTATPGIGTVTLTGVAYEHDDVATWLEALAREKGYAVPALQSSTEGLIGSRKIVNWTTTFSLTAEALSNRFVKAGGTG